VKLMHEQQRERAGGQDQSGDQLDRMLDAALARYAAVAPRPGLQERILANLHSRQIRSGRAWWQWSIVAAVVAVVIVGLALSWRSSQRSHPLLVNHPVTATRDLEQSGSEVSPKGTRVAIPGGHAPVHKRTKVLSRTIETASANPKLDQFPSPQPQTEQEMALARYVAQFHEEAVLMVRARTAASKRELEEERNEAEPGYNEDSVTR